MMKSIKYILLPAVLLAFVVSGCSDLFNKGDVEKEYGGPDVVGFYPLETSADEGATVSMEVQLISNQGLASSDISVSISVDGESTADPSQYNVPSSVTISSGSAIAEFDVQLNNSSSQASGEETVLILNISNADVGVAENFATSRIFIQGVD